MKNTIIAILLMLFYGGCSQPQSSHLSPVGNGIGRIDGDVNNASNSVDQAKPHTDSIGNAHLTDASFSLSDAKLQIVTTTKALTASQIASDKIIKDDQATHDQLTEERNHWVGYKTRLLARWIIAISVSLWLIVGVLFCINSVSPIAWIGPVIVEVANALPFFNPFMWIETYLQAKKAKAAKATATALLNTPSVLSVPASTTVEQVNDVHAALQSGSIDAVAAALPTGSTATIAGGVTV
jgi:hypothetical protein